MSKNKANGALEDGALNQVAGGTGEQAKPVNAQLHVLSGMKGFNSKWQNSQEWDLELVQMMVNAYGEDGAQALISVYGTPSAMFNS